MWKKTLKSLLLLAVIAAIAAGLREYFNYQSYHPSTDDAYIKAHSVQIAARVSGNVARIHVNSFQPVKRGQLLFEIDPQPFIIAVNKAKAQLKLVKQQIKSEQATILATSAKADQRHAELKEQRKESARILKLVAKKLAAVQAGDRARTQLKIAKAAYHAATSDLAAARAKLGQTGTHNANFRQAHAELAQAKLNLTYTKIYAPADGYIDHVNLRVGSNVIAQQPQLILVEKGSWWLDANFKETQLMHIRRGQTAKITVDIYPKHVFHGRVQQISRSSGSSFSLLPPENATGNWVKVTQRFPVKISIDDPNPQFPLRVGASATVTIDSEHD